MKTCVALAVVAIGVIGYFGYNAYRINLITNMTFEEMFAFTTRNNEEIVIAIGVIQNNEVDYSFYGKDGMVLPQSEYVYEIGSITKTFTAALIFQAILEGKIDLDDTIDKYLDLPDKDYYPTIRRLLTHTSGYKSYYLSFINMVRNRISGRNAYHGITTDDLLRRIAKVDLDDRDYNFSYSNFGISVLGMILSDVYNDGYATLMNDFINDGIGLLNTKISDGSGNLDNYWDWDENDAYLPAGALLSTVEDMLQYAQLQLQATPAYLAATHEVLAEINATTEATASRGIRMDSAGAAWMIDTVNNIIWHNGATGDYNSYLGFDLDRNIAVVVLSNLPHGYRANATVMGAKLLINLQSGE